MSHHMYRYVQVIFIFSEANIKNIITVIHYICSAAYLSLLLAPSGQPSILDIISTVEIVPAYYYYLCSTLHHHCQIHHRIHL